LCLCVGHEQGMSIVEKYDEKNNILCFWSVTITYILWEKVVDHKDDD
jgi:hypothetical protein